MKKINLIVTTLFDARTKEKKMKREGIKYI